MALRIPSRGSDQFNLRFPDGMRDRLREVAEANGRSMNAEIISRLEQSFAPQEKAILVEEVENFLNKPGITLNDIGSYANLLSQKHSQQILRLVSEIEERLKDALVGTKLESRDVELLRKRLENHGARDGFHSSQAAKHTKEGNPSTKGQPTQVLDDPFDVSLPIPERASRLRRLAEAAQAEAAQLERSANPTTPSTPTPKREKAP